MTVRTTTWIIPALLGAALSTTVVAGCAAEEAVAKASDSAVQSAVRDARDAALRTQRSSLQGDVPYHERRAKRVRPRR